MLSVIKCINQVKLFLQEVYNLATIYLLIVIIISLLTEKSLKLFIEPYYKKKVHYLLLCSLIFINTQSIIKNIE